MTSNMRNRLTEHFMESVGSWAKERQSAAFEATASSMSFLLNRLKSIESAFELIKHKKQLDVLLFSHRSEYFDQEEFAHWKSSDLIRSITFCANEKALFDITRTFDIAIVCTHVHEEHLAQLVIRTRELAKLLIAWTWDNHHCHFDNLCSCSLSDIVVPAHAFCADRLKSPHYVLAKATPLGTGQWSRTRAREYLDASLNKTRSDALSGGYILWKGAARNQLLMRLKSEIEGNELRLINEEQKTRYFDLTAKERFDDWSSYKASLQIPFSGDLSLRVFDALITGQIPIVPKNCHDLDNVIPLPMQKQLPVIRLEEVSVESVESAWEEAITAFNQSGREGIINRHLYALQNHHTTSRVQQIVKNTMSMLDSGDVGLCINNLSIGLVQTR